MIKKYSSTFLTIKNNKYLNLSTASTIGELGSHHPYFTQRSKNYLKHQNILSIDDHQEKQKYLFFYKHIPWMEAYPYFYLTDNLPLFFKKNKLSISTNNSSFEAFENHDFLSFNIDSDGSKKLLSENYFRFNPIPYLDSYDLLHVKNISLLTNHDFSSIAHIIISPKYSLTYPCKSIVFSKKPLNEKFIHCEISRKLYKSYFHYLHHPNVRKNINQATSFIEQDIELFSTHIKNSHQNKNYFKISINKNTKNDSYFLPYSMIMKDKYIFTFQDQSLYLSIPYCKNPNIFSKKLRRLLTIIL